jgi:hypothetical protein
LAPTLDDLIREKRVTSELRASVDALASRLADLHVVVSDFQPRNLVLRPDGKGFCVIDGLGETTWFRFRKLSQRLWRLSLEQMRQQTQAKIIAGKARRARDRRGSGLQKEVAAEKWLG